MKDYLVEVICDGIASSKALVIDYQKDDNDRFLGIEEEMKNLSSAFTSTLIQLDGIKQINVYPEEDFIEAQISLLKDKVFIDKIIQKIKEEKKNAQVSFCEVIDKYLKEIKLGKFNNFRDKVVDLSDIKKRVIKNLSRTETANVDKEVILIVDELIPSMLLDLKNNVKGVIAKKGGYTSHSVILCKAKEIPYVIIKDYEIHDEDHIIIDTRKKMIMVNPHQDIINEYDYLLLHTELEKPIVNFNHAGLRLMANISSNSEIRKVLTYNFDAIGLYRTEFIFMNYDKPLSYEEQFKIYHDAICKMKYKPIYFRTFDISRDKTASYIVAYDNVVENYNKNYQLFYDQVKALIMANDYNNIKIMFPMIETIEEFNYLKNKVLEIKKEQQNTSTIEIGMMLETKKALENLNTFDSVDFFSLGTNDLTRELYEASRDGTKSYHRFIDDLIKRLKVVVEYCDKTKKTLTICGELASVLNVTSMLLDIGLKNFSVSVSGIKTLELAVKEHFSKI